LCYSAATAVVAVQVFDKMAGEHTNSICNFICITAMPSDADTVLSLSVTQKLRITINQKLT